MNNPFKRISNGIFFLSCCLLFTNFSAAQATPAEPPKLVVGIVVDQMSFEQLYRYKDKYSNEGFARLLKEGYNFKNTQYNYIPTVTAAGHSSIYTGTTPSTHGIIGNSWYQRKQDSEIGNVDDPKEHIIGSSEENKTGLSPRNLLTTTISDQLRLATNFKSKVISVSLKDRGAILPGGHLANAAYWHDWQVSPGYFVSSSYYMDDVPSWVKQFNKEGRSDTYLDITWNTLLPISSYTESAPDDNPYERTLRGKDGPTFPYEFKKMREIYKELNAEYQLIWVSPYGNTLLTEFAIEAIKNEALGKDNFTDLINISYSVPDVIGHGYSRSPPALPFSSPFLPPFPLSLPLSLPPSPLSLPPLPPSLPPPSPSLPPPSPSLPPPSPSLPPSLQGDYMYTSVTCLVVRRMTAGTNSCWVTPRL